MKSTYVAKKKKDWTGSSVEWTEDEKSGLGKHKHDGQTVNRLSM